MTRGIGTAIYRYRYNNYSHAVAVVNTYIMQPGRKCKISYCHFVGQCYNYTKTAVATYANIHLATSMLGTKSRCMGMIVTADCTSIYSCNLLRGPSYPYIDAMPLRMYAGLVCSSLKISVSPLFPPTHSLYLYQTIPISSSTPQLTMTRVSY